MQKHMYDFINKLNSHNQEEQSILDNKSDIDRHIFQDRYMNTVSFNKIVPDGKMISIRKHTRFIHYPPHSHDYVEICYVLRGKSTQNIEGRKINLSTGDLLFLGPGVSHEIFPCSEDDIVINFIIHRKFFSYIFEFIDETSSLSSFFTDVIFKKTSSISLIYTTLGNQGLENLLHTILSELDNENNLTESRIKFLLGLLILDLTTLKCIKIEKLTYEEGILGKVISYMERNLKSANLNEISDELNLKNYNLSKLIKKESGVTFNTLLRDIRFGKFCELVKVKNVSINDLALEVGFSNTSDFYKKFKAKYNMSPKEYRKNEKE